MANKTKAELEVEIKLLKNELNAQSKKEQLDKAATELRDTYDSFVKAGFSEEQAWEITRTLIDNGTSKKSIF